MNINDTLRIIRTIQAITPNQRFENDDLPSLWQEVLAGIRYEDAQEAVIEHARHLAFIAVHEIYEGALDVRRARQAKVNVTEVNADSGDLSHELRERRALAKAIADGDMDAAGYQAYLASRIPLTSPTVSIGARA